MRAALCEAQHLRVHRPRPMPWMRGLVGAALGHVLVLPLAFRPLSDRFTTAVRQWAAFVRDTLGYANCIVGTDLLKEGRTDQIVDELRVIFAGKPHSTLTKRLGT